MSTISTTGATTGSLGFQVAGGAVSVDPETAEIRVTLGSDLALTVTRYDAAGAASGRWRLAIASEPPPAAVGTLEDRLLVHGSGPVVVEAAAAFAGTGLVFAATGGGATADPATGRVTLPTDALRRAETVTVTASNAGGSAAAAFGVTVAAAPVAPAAAGGLPAVAWPLGGPARTVSAQAGFAGADLVYSLVAAPAGATIDAGTGLITVPTALPLEAAPVTVRATNAAGSATQGFAVTLRTTATAFDAAAALAEMSFVSEGAAPSWSLDAGGFARLVTASEGVTHGLWSKAAGIDGRVRALVRFSAGDAVDRPFCLGGRLVKSGSDFRGVRIDALAIAGTTRLDVRHYTGAGAAATSLATATAPWAEDVWTWVELELDAASVRCRLYPETASAPAWQIEAPLTGAAAVAGGAVGIGGLGRWGQRPQVDLRRIEFLPLVPAAPVAADAGEWVLGQESQA